jgi:hypothetical protein
MPSAAKLPKTPIKTMMLVRIPPSADIAPAAIRKTIDGIGRQSWFAKTASSTPP